MRFLLFVFASIVGVSALLPLAHAQRPSFNCAVATALDEAMICRDGNLANLDNQLSAIFRVLLDTLNGSDKALLRETERLWLAKRAACGARADCIANMYRIRIEQLNILVAGNPTTPAIPASGPSATGGPTKPASPGGSKDACDAFPTLC
jgi:uncharacterized protein